MIVRAFSVFISYNFIDMSHDPFDARQFIFFIYDVYLGRVSLFCPSGCVFHRMGVASNLVAVRDEEQRHIEVKQ